MEIFPIESQYSSSLRSAIITDLVYTKAYGREVNTFNVDASPAGTAITITFKGSKSLFEILDDFALEDNYDYYITRRTDSGALNGNAGAYGGGVTVLTFDGTTNSYAADELNKGILKFTSGDLDGSSFKITDSTSTTITVSGDASTADDDDPFTLEIDSLYYKAKESVVSTLSLSSTTDEIYDFTLPEAGQDIKNRIHIIGDQKQGGTINDIGAVTTVASNSMDNDPSDAASSTLVDAAFSAADDALIDATLSVTSGT
jgi:hypothetical protein